MDSKIDESKRAEVGERMNASRDACRSSYDAMSAEPAIRGAVWLAVEKALKELSSPNAIRERAEGAGLFDPKALALVEAFAKAKQAHQAAVEEWSKLHGIQVSV